MAASRKSNRSSYYRDVKACRAASYRSRGSRWRAAPSIFDDHNLEIFARHDHDTVVGAVEAVDQRPEIGNQGTALLFFERRQGLHYRSVIGREHIDEVHRRAVTEHEIARLGMDRPGACAKQFRQTFAVPHSAGDLHPPAVADIGRGP